MLWMLLPNQNLLESSTRPSLVISSEMLLVWPAPVKTCHSVGAGARKDQVGATIPWWARPQWVPPTPTHKSLPSMRVLPGQLATDCAKAESTTNPFLGRQFFLETRFLTVDQTGLQLLSLVKYLVNLVCGAKTLSKQECSETVEIGKAKIISLFSIKQTKVKVLFFPGVTGASTTQVRQRKARSCHWRTTRASRWGRCSLGKKR